MTTATAFRSIQGTHSEEGWTQLTVLIPSVWTVQQQLGTARGLQARSAYKINRIPGSKPLASLGTPITKVVTTKANSVSQT